MSKTKTVSAQTALTHPNGNVLRTVTPRPESLERQRIRKLNNPRPPVPHGVVPQPARTDADGKAVNFGGLPGQATPFDFALDGTQVVALYNVAGDANSSDSASNQGGNAVGTADLQLLFWGNSWPNQNPAPGQIVGAIQTMLNGPYLEQLGQYGFSGLNFREPLQVLSDPPNGYSDDDIGNMVWDLIDQGTFPEPDDDGGNILYAVFLPSEVTQGNQNARGAHLDATDYDFPFDYDHAPVAWISFGNIDYITDVFSHELMEMITDPQPSNGWIMNRNINGGNELGDACNNTVDRMDGLLLQAYWSNEFKACVLPMGPLRSLGLSGSSSAVARTQEHIDMFWPGFDGSVEANSWDSVTGVNWNAQLAVTQSGLTVASRVMAVCRTPQNTDLFWIDSFGTVWSSFASTNVNNGQWTSFPLTAPGSAMPDSLAAVARTPDHLDIFWIAPDGSAWTNWWDAHANNGQWNTAFTITSPGSALAGALTATCRNPNHIDVFWIANDASVWTNWWDAAANNGAWNTPFPISPAGIAATAALTAVSREPNQLDVFWVTLDGSVYTNWWNANANNGAWNTAFAIAGPGSALGGSIAAVGRLPGHLDVFWIALDGSVWTNWWDAAANNGAWNQPFPISAAGAAVPGSLDAACRTPQHIDVFWTSSDAAVWTNWWDSGANNGAWNTPFTIAQPGSAMVKDYSVPAVSSSWALCRQSQQLDAFWTTPVGAIATNYWNAFINAGNWNVPFDLSAAGSSGGSMPVVVARSANHIDLFWVAADGSLESAVWDPFANNGWTAPFTIAPAGTAPAKAALSAVIRNPYHIDLFWQTSDGAIWTVYWDAFFNNARWNNPFPITPAHAGTSGGLVTAISRTPTQIDLFWTDSEGTVFSTWWNAFANGGNWNGAFPISIVEASTPGAPVAAACRHANHIDVFWIDRNGTVWSNWWELFVDNAQWHVAFPTTALGAAAPGAPIVAACPHCFHIDVAWAGPRDSMWSNFWDQFAGESWTQPISLLTGLRLFFGLTPLAATIRNAFELHLFHVLGDHAVEDCERAGVASSAGWNIRRQIAPFGSA